MLLGYVIMDAAGTLLAQDMIGATQLLSEAKIWPPSEQEAATEYMRALKNSGALRNWVLYEVRPRAVRPTF